MNSSRGGRFTRHPLYAPPALRATGARLPEEFSVLRVELVSDVAHHACGYALLRDRRDRPSVADGLGFLDTFLIGDAPVELREREAVPSILA